MSTCTATYCPEDNKLRLYASTRLDAETYARVKAAGFTWAPKQDLFVAPMWTPQREDLLLELAGEIDDEDRTLVQRSEERAERFEGYQENRTNDAESARRAVSAIADNIPLGQPILIGHHSEKHARRDAEKIANGMRRAVRMWETAQYWQDRAAGALRAAKYKERPDVRARRIKKMEADLRKVQRSRTENERHLRVWETLHEPGSIKRKDGAETTFRERAVFIAGRSGCGYSIYSDLTADKITPEEAQSRVLEACRASIAWADRWIGHYENRLVYERAMLGEAGGIEADRNQPMKGGACKCWASPRGGWSYIQKVIKVSVTVLDNWGNGGENFTRTIPFDKLQAIMSPAEVENARLAGELFDLTDKTGGIGFLLRKVSPPKVENVCPDGASCPDPDCVKEREVQGIIAPGAQFEAMRETLRAGVQIITAPQLFPTPRELAQRMADLVDVRPGHRVLEPSAGTGALLGAMGGRMFGHDPERGEVVAVEINSRLAERLRSEFPLTSVRCADFLACNGDLGTFDRIVMNPPFGDAQDVEHIRHALEMLKPGGRLVALCANGPRQRAAFEALADSWEDLPAGTFKEAGTMVNAALVVLER